MREYITLDSEVTEFRMMFTCCNQRTIAIEGETDELVLKQFIRCDEFRFTPRHNYKNVLEIVAKANENNNSFLLGIIDKDFHTITSYTGHKFGCIPNIVYTDYHDIEMSLFESPAFDKYIRVFGSVEKLKKVPDVKGCIYSIAEVIGALRLVSIEEDLKLKFEGLESNSYLDWRDPQIDIIQLLKVVTQRTQTTSKQKLSITNEELALKIQDVMKRKLDRTLLCNGHDVLETLCFCMRSKFATKSSNELCEETVFRELLLAFTIEDFMRTNMAQAIQTWSQSNFFNP